MKNIEIKLKELRKDKNLSQEELASRLGVSRQSIISLERGEYLPSLPLIVDLINFFEMPFDELICCDGIHIIEKGGENTMPREITPWSPFREVSTIHDTIDRMFDEAMSPRFISSPAISIPTVNIRDTEKSILVEAELPGVKLENLDIEISEDALTIKGEKKAESEIKEKDFFRREFSYGSFTRTIPLPVPIQEDKVEAELKHGVLKIELPKREEVKPKVKKIAVKNKD